jgi:hypothetical protein
MAICTTVRPCWTQRGPGDVAQGGVIAASHRQAAGAAPSCLCLPSTYHGSLKHALYLAPPRYARAAQADGSTIGDALPPGV